MTFKFTRDWNKTKVNINHHYHVLGHLHKIVYLFLLPRNKQVSKYYSFLTRKIEAKWLSSLPSLNSIILTLTYISPLYCSFFPSTEDNPVLSVSTLNSFELNLQKILALVLVYFHTSHPLHSSIFLLSSDIPDFIQPSLPLNLVYFLNPRLNHWSKSEHKCCSKRPPLSSCKTQIQQSCC